MHGHLNVRSFSSWSDVLDYMWFFHFLRTITQMTYTANSICHKKAITQQKTNNECSWMFGANEKTFVSKHPFYINIQKWVSWDVILLVLHIQLLRVNGLHYAAFISILVSCTLHWVFQFQCHKVKPKITENSSQCIWGYFHIISPYFHVHSSLHSHSLVVSIQNHSVEV